MNNFDYPQGKHFAVWSYFDQHTRSFDTSVHSHAAAELIYVENGRCKYEVKAADTGRAQSEHLKSGDVILTAAGTPHRLAVTSPARLLLLELRAADNEAGKACIDAKTVVDTCPSLKKAFEKNSHIVINDFMYVKQAVLRVVSLLNTNRLEYTDHFFTQVLIAELLLNIDESYAKAYLGNPYIDIIIEFIARSYQENISVKSIADAVNLNPSYMQKLFARHMGNTVYDYLTQFRVDQAIALMKSTNMAFEDIAAEVGFNNRQTFYNAFKAYTNYTPKVFKKYLASPAVSYKAEE